VTDRTQYTLPTEPVDRRYDGLLRVGAHSCGEAWLVVRPELLVSENAQRVLGRLRPFLIAAEARESWPGTRLVGHTAAVHRYRLTATVLGILRGEARRLYAWVQPHLPEDLALVSPDGTPWLTTISHERDAYLRLTTDEHHRLLSVVPDLPLERDPPPDSAAQPVPE
jgi:hypothetical protein